MSISVMNAVWQCEEITDRAELCVLLALADWADDEGTCYPSLTQLCSKARMTKQGAINVLQRMRGTWVSWDENQGGRSVRNQYRIIGKRVNGVYCLGGNKESTGLTVSEDKRVNGVDQKQSTGLTRNKPSYKPSSITNPQPSANNQSSADLEGSRARATPPPPTPVFDLSFLGEKDEPHEPGIRDALGAFPTPFPDQLIMKYWPRKSFIDHSSMVGLVQKYGWVKFVAGVIIAANNDNNPGLNFLSGILRRFGLPKAPTTRGEVPTGPTPINHAVSAFGTEEDFDRLLKAG